MRTRQCVGFGKYERKCLNKANGKKHKSDYWCDRCEKLRRVTVGKQMQDILTNWPSEVIR